MRIRHEKVFPFGYSSITEIAGKHGEMLMDFGLLRLRKGQEHRFAAGREKAFLLLSGSVELTWDGNRNRAARTSLFDQGPWCLNVPENVEVGITSLDGEAEVSVHAVENPRRFAAKLFSPADCRNEERGRGTMGETATRIVRTIIEDPAASWSNLVLGEVITFPGKWSSYPPHHHPHPEIYHYRFHPSTGFGLCGIGDDAYVLREQDTVLIPPGAVHPHASAPGYAMYYIWTIRHLDGNRYRVPTFVDEHYWVTNPDAKMWLPRG